MASRSTIRTWLLHMLGADADDPAFTAAILNPILQQAADSLVSEIQRANRSYLVKSVTLAADSSTSHDYTFATQASAITDFAFWLEVRWKDKDGLLLDEAGIEELNGAGGDYFAVLGPDEEPVLVTSDESEAGKAIYLRYGYWPAEMADDNAAPGGIPTRFHDVVALEALFAFGLGGEQRIPPELSTRWFDRRAQLLAHVGRRGVQPSRTRLYKEE